MASKKPASKTAKIAAAAPATKEGGASLLTTGADVLPASSGTAEPPAPAPAPAAPKSKAKVAALGVATVVDIARVCHEVNHSYCDVLGDLGQVPFDEAPVDIQQSAITGVEFALANPDATPRDQHDAWCASKIKDGWAYGAKKDAANKTHPCLVAYDHLPAFQRTKDGLFQAVVRAMKPMLGGANEPAVEAPKPA